MKLTELEQDLFNKWETKERSDKYWEEEKVRVHPLINLDLGIALVSLIFSLGCFIHYECDKPTTYLTIFGVNALLIWGSIFLAEIITALIKINFSGIAARKLKAAYFKEFKDSLKNVDLATEGTIFDFNKRKAILTAQYEEFSQKIETQLTELKGAKDKLKDIERRTKEGSKLTLVHNILKEIDEVSSQLESQREKADNLYTGVSKEIRSGCQELRDQLDLVEVLKTQRLLNASKFVIEENKAILLSMENCLALFDREIKSLNQEFTASYEAIEELGALNVS